MPPWCLQHTGDPNTKGSCRPPQRGVLPAPASHGAGHDAGHAQARAQSEGHHGGSWRSCGSLWCACGWARRGGDGVPGDGRALSGCQQPDPIRRRNLPRHRWRGGSRLEAAAAEEVVAAAAAGGELPHVRWNCRPHSLAGQPHQDWWRFCGSLRVRQLRWRWGRALHDAHESTLVAQARMALAMPMVAGGLLPVQE